jgi:uncharacterized membrane protein (DUF485 family)
MAEVKSKEQVDTSSDAIIKQAQEQIAKKVESEAAAKSPANPNSTVVTSSQLAQVLALLNALDDISGDQAHSQAIIDFPLEGSDCTESGFVSRTDNTTKTLDGLNPILKELGEKMLANPSPALAKFMQNGELSLPKLLQEGTTILQNATKEFEQLAEEAKKEEAKKDGAEKLAEETKKSKQEELKATAEAIKEQKSEEETGSTSSPSTATNENSESNETSSDIGFSFEANDCYVFMTTVLATMSDKINQIEAKLAENSSQTADWNYTMNQAFINSAKDALNKAIEDKKHYEHLLHKQKGLNKWLEPLMITVMVVSTILLCVAGQPWLAVVMLGLMTMQLTHGTDKLISAIAAGLEGPPCNMSHDSARIVADVIYVVVVVALTAGVGAGAGAYCGAESAVAEATAIGATESIMVGTTAMATSSLFDDIATIVINKYGTDENDTRLALMCAGLGFCLITNVTAGYYIGSAAANSNWMANLGEKSTKLLMYGALADLAVTGATCAIQILLGLNRLAMADAEESVTESTAWNTYFNTLTQQTTQIAEQIIEANNRSISAIGEGLSTALNTYAAAGDNLARSMA